MRRLVNAVLAISLTSSLLLLYVLYNGYVCGSPAIAVNNISFDARCDETFARQERSFAQAAPLHALMNDRYMHSNAIAVHILSQLANEQALSYLPNDYIPSSGYFIDDGILVIYLFSGGTESTSAILDVLDEGLDYARSLDIPIVVFQYTSETCDSAVIGTAIEMAIAKYLDYAGSHPGMIIYRETDSLVSNVMQLHSLLGSDDTLCIADSSVNQTTLSSSNPVVSSKTFVGPSPVVFPGSGMFDWVTSHATTQLANRTRYVLVGNATKVGNALSVALAAIRAQLPQTYATGSVHLGHSETIFRRNVTLHNTVWYFSQRSYFNLHEYAVIGIQVNGIPANQQHVNDTHN